MAFRKVRQHFVSREEFAHAYRAAVKNGLTIQELADSIEASYGAVYSRIKKFREAGVKLKPLASGLRGGGNRINVSRIQAIIDGKIK